MTYPYTAIIERKSRTITGMDADGKYCLDGNEKLEITPLEPETFRAFTLREVAKLTFTGGRWLLDGEGYSGRWFDGLEKAGGVAGRMDSAAMTDMKTVHWLRQTLEGLSPEARTKIKGVAWFDEGFDKIEGETPERCKLLQDEANRHYGGGYEIPPKPPAEEYRPVLLADFHVSPQSTGDGQHVMSYGAVIEGRKRQVTGFDEQRNLVLADGQRYVFELLNFNPPGQQREEPDGDVFGWPLLEAAKLQQWEGSWKWNDEAPLLSQWLEAARSKAKGVSGWEFSELETFKRSLVKSRLNQLPDAIRTTVRGVAWFKHHDGAGGWYKPILLKSFRLLSSNAKPKPSKTTRARQPKPVARFEDDFSLAIIPKKSENEDILSLGLELQTMVREIVRANGRLAGPKLIAKLKVALKRESNIRPDRWFQSPIAVQLREAGLLDKTGLEGRSVVYLAKEKTT